MDGWREGKGLDHTALEMIAKRRIIMLGMENELD